MDSPGASGPAQRVAIVGTPRSALAGLQALRDRRAHVVGIVTHVDRTGHAAGLAPLLSRARSLEIPVLSPRGATVATALRWLTHLALDHLVSVGWSDLLTDDMFRVARHGVVGLDPAPLRGSRPSLAADWAVLRGGTVTGHVLLVLLPAVAAAAAEPRRAAQAEGLEEDDAASEVYEALARTGDRLLQTERADSAIGRSSGPGVAQLEYGLPASGLGLTSFDRPAADVQRWVQAMKGTAAGAFAVLRGRHLLIWECEPAWGTDRDLPAGTVLGADTGVVVSTRGGALRLLRVQEPGREREPAAEWFLRSDLPPGCAFEPVGWSDLAWLRP